MDENTWHDASTVGTSKTLKRPAGGVPQLGGMLDPSRWQAFATTHQRGLQSALAFFIYTALALVYFWLPILGAPANTAIGARSPDVEQNLWYLKWWPYAITHHMNPFLVQNMWVPHGYNLAWQTGFPFPSLALWPITMTALVVATYNVLFTASFTLALGYLCSRVVFTSAWGA